MASYLLSCTSCGVFEEPTTLEMRRASTSRREQPFDSPPVRSRSQERASRDATADRDHHINSNYYNHNNNNDQDDNVNHQQDHDKHEEFLDALAEQADSTDNDSIVDNVIENDSDGELKAQSTHRPRLDSGSGTTISKRGMHVRAMSDPFDTQHMKDAVAAAVQDEDAMNHPPTQTTAAKVPAMNHPSTNKNNNMSSSPYPTLLRYPVAATRNKNCWSEPPVTIFSVRGPKYFENKKKQTSGPYLLTARGTDILLFDQPVNLGERSHLILGGHLRSLPTLMINFQFPWGVMVLYFELPAKLAIFLMDKNTPISSVPGLTNPEKTLAKWLVGDENYKNDRLKLIPYVAEGPWVVRNMVTGRPAIIGRKLPVSYRVLPGDGHYVAPLCECTLDIGSSSATAKRIVSVCRRYMSGLSADIGFVIQAETPDELPEQMMGSIRVHGPDPLKAPKL